MSYAEDRTLYGALRRTNEGNWLEESLEGGKKKRKSFGMFQKTARPKVMSPLSWELENATQQVPGALLPLRGRVYNANQNN